MGLLNNITDRFKGGEFAVSGKKKLGTVSKEFKEAFGLSLLIYKGNQKADEKLSFAQLNDRTKQKIDTSINNNSLKLKASMTIDDAEKAFMDTFGVKVQVGDKDGDIIKAKFGKTTLGDAARGDLKKK